MNIVDLLNDKQFEAAVDLELAEYIKQNGGSISLLEKHLFVKAFTKGYLAHANLIPPEIQTKEIEHENYGGC